MSNAEPALYAGDEDRERAQRAALAAAFDILNGSLDVNDDPDRQKVRRLILQACTAIERIQSEHEEAFKQAHPDLVCYGPSVDVMHIVATAFWQATNGIPADIDGAVHPYSRAGNILCGFASAAVLLAMHDNFQTALRFGAEDYYDFEGAAAVLAEDRASDDDQAAADLKNA